MTSVDRRGEVLPQNKAIAAIQVRLPDLMGLSALENTLRAAVFSPDNTFSPDFGTAGNVMLALSVKTGGALFDPIQIRLSKYSTSGWICKFGMYFDREPNFEIWWASRQNGGCSHTLRVHWIHKTPDLIVDTRAQTLALNFTGGRPLPPVSLDKLGQLEDLIEAAQLTPRSFAGFEVNRETGTIGMRVVEYTGRELVQLVLPLTIRPNLDSTMERIGVDIPDLIGTAKD